MKLPFSDSQFLAVFGQYNETFFVAIVVLWIATLVVVAFWLAGKRLDGRWISLLLCIHWVWVGVFYHFLYFARINPAARLFSILFIVQAICFGWYTVRPGKLDFYEKRPFWYPVSVALCLYSLAYPFLNLLTGFYYPQMPAFAVPCPSTLLTAGFLLSANPPGHRLLILIPIAWTMIASSAAFLFRIYADMALPLAGIFLIVAAVRMPRPA